MVLSNGIVVTAGHLFLNEFGAFERIDCLLARGGKIVLENGTLQAVAAERIVYSEATRHLYEEAEEIVYASVGGVALQPEIRRGWRTYNFEVETYHTYIAGGVRVHNDSLQEYLNLSVLMRNDAYVAVSFDDIERKFGTAAAATSAYSNEPFASPSSFSSHLNDMIDAYAEAVASKDFDRAEGIRGGISNVLGTGIGPALGQAREAVDKNQNSTVRTELQSQFNNLSSSQKVGFDALATMNAIDRGTWDGRHVGLPNDAIDHIASRSNGFLSGIGDAIGGVIGTIGDVIGGLLGGIADAIGGVVGGIGDAIGGMFGGDPRPSPGGDPLASTRRENVNKIIAPAREVQRDSTVLTTLADGTVISKTDLGARKAFAIFKDQDVLELGELVTREDGTKEEAVTSALPGDGGVQETLSIYEKDGQLRSRMIKVNGIVRTIYKQNDAGKFTSNHYGEDGTLVMQAIVQDGNASVWEYDSGRKNDWVTRKTYYTNKGQAAWVSLKHDRGLHEARSYLADFVLPAVIGTLTILDSGKNGTGNARHNVMRGNDLANALHGAAGNDTLKGGNGDDALYGDDGHDRLFGEADRDTLRGGAGNDMLDGGDGADRLFGDAGDDVLVGGTGNDALDGGAGRDRLSGEGWDDTLYGEGGDDTLIGGEGYDVLNGGDGDDSLEGGSEGDRLEGATGDDTLLAGAGDDELYGGAGNDSLSAGTGLDRLWGDAGQDALDGGDGADELYGGDGDDTLVGGNGHDFLTGGAGNDLLNGGTGQDALDGGDGSDVLRGESEDDTLEGGDGSDTLSGGDGDDRLHGDEGADTLKGEDGSDYLDGGAGDDVLYGGRGNDGLLGSDGNDTLFGGDGSDGLVGDAGDDRLDGEGGDDLLKGGAGADWLSGALGKDTLYGGQGADSLIGGAGDDDLYGDGDADSLDGGDGNDRLWGGDGNDSLAGGAGNDVLTGDGGNDTLMGAQGDDMLAGGDGDDSLDGGGGHDQLFGGNGNDILIGGPDVDYIDGGDGTDTIVLSSLHSDYKIRFNPAIGRFSIVDLRAGSPDGTDLAAIEIFRFADGAFTKAELDYVIGADEDIAWDVLNSDGSKSTLGWRPWANDATQFEIFIQRHDINNALMSETVFRPDGSRTAYAKDVADTESWDTYLETYDTKAQLIKKQYENDNGSRTTEEWDPDGLQPWSHRITESVNVGGVYRDSYQRDTLHEPNPDPSIVDVVEREWDATGTAAWEEIVREYDIFTPNSTLWLTEDTKLDGGARILKGKDYAKDGANYSGPSYSNPRAAEWEKFEERRDAAGNKFYESYTYYGNQNEPSHTIIKEWDFYGQDWDNSTLYIVGVDTKVWKEIIYDSNPLYSKIRWDWQHVALDWSQRVTYTDNASKIVLQEDTWTDDVGAVLKGTVRQWDYTTGITWQRSETDYINNGGTAVVTQTRVLHDNNTYSVTDPDPYAQSSEYSQRTITYVSETRTDQILKDLKFLRIPTNYGGTVTIDETDYLKQAKNWDRLHTEYIENTYPQIPEQYLRVYQIQYYDFKIDYPHLVRHWDYTPSVNWKYEVEIYDDSKFRSAINFEMDDETWKTYDYDSGAEKWGTIIQYLKKDKSTVSKKEVLFDDLHFVIQKWDVDKTETWKYYYTQRAHQTDSKSVWEWYIDDNDVKHYVVGDASGAIEDPTAPPRPDPDAAFSHLGQTSWRSGQGDRPNRISTSRNDMFVANGEPIPFVFKGRFGNDVFSKFKAGLGRGDVIAFDKSIFSDFKSVRHASVQKGDDIVITADGHGTLTLKQVTLASLHADDFRFLA